ncbi:hypothetical protein BHE90_013651, partial [Fusarium euwallaceae]
TPKSPFNGGTGFIGGVALRNYQRDMEAQAAEAIDSGEVRSVSQTLDWRYEDRFA